MQLRTWKTQLIAIDHDLYIQHGQVIYVSTDKCMLNHDKIEYSVQVHFT